VHTGITLQQGFNENKERRSVGLSHTKQKKKKKTLMATRHVRVRMRFDVALVVKRKIHRTRVEGGYSPSNYNGVNGKKNLRH